jgi:phenylacetate-CoA ligase
MSIDGADTAAPPGVTLDQIKAMMSESLFWPSSLRIEYQRNQLEQLVRHAVDNVPFYKDRLGILFDSSGGLEWSRWEQVPIVKRADLRLRSQELLSKSNPPSHGLIMTASSSGSTGIPVTVTFPQLFTFVAKAAWDRFRALHGIDYADGVVDFALNFPPHVPAEAEHYPPRKGDTVFLIRRNISIERKLFWLKQSSFRFLHDIPNHAEILARANLRAGKPVRLDAICGIGMAITDEQRQLFRESFGAKSIMAYSSKEGSLLAFECCHAPQHFHICSELGLMEVVDDQGHAVRPGTAGRCIITPFYNSVQPLIRYEQGDTVVAGSTCTGRITLPVLTEIAGRKDSMFNLTGGDTTFIGMDVATVRDLLSADAYQLAQVGPNDVEVRYVSSAKANAKKRSLVSKHLLHLAGFELNLSYKQVADLPYNSGGKQQRFVNDYHQS